MKARPLRLPCLLHDDQLADLGLHEDEEVEEDGRDDCSKHCPHWQGGFWTSSWRDQPTPGTAVRHLADSNTNKFVNFFLKKFVNNYTNIHPCYLNAIRDIQLLRDRVSCRPVDQQHSSDCNRNSKISKSSSEPPLQELAVTKDFEGVGNYEGAEHEDQGEQGNVGLHGGLASCTAVTARVFLGSLAVFGSLQEGVRFEDLAQLVEGLVDEEKGNKPGKDVFGELGEESDKG